MRSNVASRASVAAVLHLAMISLGAAQTRSPASYERLKEKGNRALESGQYDKAILSYRQAYDQRADARLLYNLGLAHFKRYQVSKGRADLVRAEDLFSRFLRLVRTNDPRYRGQAATVKRVRTLARGYLMRIRHLARRTTPEPTTTTAPPASKPASLPPEKQPTSRSVVLPPIPPRKQPATRPAFLPPKKQQQPTRKPAAAGDREASSMTTSGWHWLFYGLAASGAVVAGVTGGLALHYEDEATTRFSLGDRGSDALASRANNLALSTDVALGVTAASIVAAVILHYRSWKKRAPTTGGRQPAP